MSRERWYCETCGGVSEASELLRGPHPFLEQDIVGCPHCRHVECLVGACWACDSPSVGGAPFPDGDYRLHCSAHSPEGLE